MKEKNPCFILFQPFLAIVFLVGFGNCKVFVGSDLKHHTQDYLGHAITLVDDGCPIENTQSLRYPNPNSKKKS